MIVIKKGVALFGSVKVINNFALSIVTQNITKQEHYDEETRHK